MLFKLFNKLRLKWKYRGKLAIVLENYEKVYGRCNQCNAVIIPDKKRIVEVSLRLSGGDAVQRVTVTDAACPICEQVYKKDVYGEAESVQERMGRYHR